MSFSLETQNHGSASPGPGFSSCSPGDTWAWSGKWKVVGWKVEFGSRASECESVRCSVMPASLQPRGLKPTRLLCPWNSPGQHAGVGCHFLKICITVSFEESWSKLSNLTLWTSTPLWDPLALSTCQHEGRPWFLQERPEDKVAILNPQSPTRHSPVLRRGCTSQGCGWPIWLAWPAASLCCRGARLSQSRPHHLTLPLHPGLVSPSVDFTNNYLENKERYEWIFLLFCFQFVFWLSPVLWCGK